MLSDCMFVVPVECLLLPSKGLRRAVNGVRLSIHYIKPPPTLTNMSVASTIAVTFLTPVTIIAVRVFCLSIDLAPC